jgi:hypothetical protein
MPKYLVTLQRVDPGMRVAEVGAGTQSQTQLNQLIAGKDTIRQVALLSEAQLQGICFYVRACELGLNTGAVETAVTAIT